MEKLKEVTKKRGLELDTIMEENSIYTDRSDLQPQLGEFGKFGDIANLRRANIFKGYVTPKTTRDNATKLDDSKIPELKPRP